MSDAVEKLKPVLAALSAADRAELVNYLRGFDDYEEELTPEEWEEAWLEEINRRVADMDSGKTVGIPAEEVMRKLREKYG
jgi:putative addiction module component (TIGR02574 family)